MKVFAAIVLVALVGCVYGRAIRDAKSDLIEKGQALVKKADEAITKLTADKKDHEVTVIKTQEQHLQKLITDLQAATDDAKIKTLERELTGIEARLDHELTRINATPSKPTDPKTPTNPAKRDAKSDLIEKGNALVKKAEDAITKLTADKKTQEAAMVKTQEAHLKKVIADLQAATEDAKVKTLEHELTLMENRLDHELARINGQPANPPKTPVDPPTNPAKRDAKSDLIEKGQALVKKADEAITKLTADKKDHEVTVIKTQEQHLQKLITDLQAATDDAKIKTLERELTGIEARLDHELTRINATPSKPTDPKTPTNPAKRDVKSDLIAKGQELVKKAEEAITKLTADKKDHEASLIKTQEAHLKKLLADLQAATDDAKAKTLEHDLNVLENRLNHELTRISAPTQPTDPKTPVVDPPANPAKRDAKSDLIEKGNALVKKAEDAITKLTADKKTQEAAMVKTQEAHLKKVIADLQAATDDAKVKTLEHELTLMENRLDHELARINGQPANPPKTPVDPPTTN